MHILLALLLQVAPVEVPQPEIQAVVEAMIERAEHDARRQIAGGRWTKERIDEDITDPRKAKTEHRERYRVWGDGSSMLQQKVLRDEKAITEQARPLPMFIDRAFLEQFDYAFEEPARIQCGARECWRISFTPKLDVRPKDGDLENVLMGSAAGTLLVDCKGYGIVVASAHSIQPYNSFKVDIYWFSVVLTQMSVHGTMVTSTIEISYAYNPIIGKAKTVRRFYEYTDVHLPPS